MCSWRLARLLGSRGRAHSLDKASRAISLDKLLAEPGQEHLERPGWLGTLSIVAARVMQ